MKWLLIKIVRAYQTVLSPVLHKLGGAGSGCRFVPTCSQYFIEAVQLHGAMKGAWLGVKRIARCQPWGGFGDDPVPQPRRKCTCDPPDSRV